ncbi:hypothetical protein PRIPAC_97358, partial [Pristionchus pacificus]|uniref:Uncharacterized protein n=1 Tax=Pristionchus pacificus TaxID=54126 RepID=A0A2A6CU64_PRIPA
MFRKLSLCSLLIFLLLLVTTSYSVKPTPESPEAFVSREMQAIQILAHSQSGRTKCSGIPTVLRSMRFGSKNLLMKMGRQRFLISLSAIA